jgi:hypothetical protein
MRVAFEEAFAVLKKWESEETPICVLVSVNGASFSLSGFIASLDSLSVTVSHLTEDAEKIGEFLIPFYPFSIFGYREVREAKGSVDPRIASTLLLAGTGMECVFYELDSKNED